MGLVAGRHMTVAFHAGWLLTLPLACTRQFWAVSGTLALCTMMVERAVQWRVGAQFQQGPCEGRLMREAKVSACVCVLSISPLFFSGFPWLQYNQSGLYLMCVFSDRYS